jgi:hypothetical protein
MSLQRRAQSTPAMQPDGKSNPTDETTAVSWRSSETPVIQTKLICIDKVILVKYWLHEYAIGNLSPT